MSSVDRMAGGRQLIGGAGLMWMALFSSPLMAQQASGCAAYTVNGTPYQAIRLGSVTSTPTISGTCLGCAVLNPAFVINGDDTDYATLIRSVALLDGGGVSLRVRNPSAVYLAGQTVGLELGIPPQVLAVELLASLEVTTYLDGVSQNTNVPTPGLLSPLLTLSALTLIGGEDRSVMVQFTPSRPFNEIELRLPSTVTAFTELNYYNACVLPLTAVRDQDNDGRPDSADNCPVDANANQIDADSDGVGSVCDNCPTAANAGQGNVDGDAQGDACDADIDNDGVPNGEDNCPRVVNANQADADNDGIGDACEPIVVDSDGDGVPDASDNCPAVPNPGQADTDADGIGDACDETGNLTCGQSAAHVFHPLLLPTAATIATVEPVCLLCTVQDQDNAINANPVDYASLTRGVGALTGETALRVRSTAEQYPAGRRALVTIQDPSSLLTADLLPSLEIRTYLGNTVQETSEAAVPLLPPLLDLDVLGLLGNPDQRRIILNTTKPFDGVEVRLPALVTALADLRLFNVCVETPPLPPPPTPTPTPTPTPPPGCGTAPSPSPPDFCARDDDGDGVDNGIDNCPQVANAAQTDADADGIGDACDTGNDADGDGVANGQDNCPSAPNPDQTDTDDDGIGDICDDNPDVGDADGDGIPDASDNCPAVPNADQLDADGDDVGDVCEQPLAVTVDAAAAGSAVCGDKCLRVPASAALTVRWDSTAGASCSVDQTADGFDTPWQVGALLPLDGARLLSVTDDAFVCGGVTLMRRFAVRCSDAVHSVTDYVDVQFDGSATVPVIDRFQVDPQAIGADQSARVFWETRFACSGCTASGDGWSGGRPADGPVAGEVFGPVTDDGTYEFALSCGNTQGIAQAQRALTAAISRTAAPNRPNGGALSLLQLLLLAVLALGKATIRVRSR